MARALLVSGLGAVLLAIVASTQEIGSAAANALWILAFVSGSLALLAGYGLGIAWARRRKRLWG